MFGLNESAILFVVVLGAAPSIANGLINGVDNIPPVLLRAGRVLGARGLSSVRHVVMPAALPSFVGGLKQGWAFAWRSLLAGELIVLLGKPSLGQELQGSRDLSNYPMMYSVMVMIFIIGDRRRRAGVRHRRAVDPPALRPDGRQRVVARRLRTRDRVPRRRPSA